MDHSSTVPHPAATQPPAARKWWILIAVGLCLFLGSVDGSIINVAVPTLIVKLNTDFPTVQWVILSYLLGLALLLVGMGRLADMVGKKRIFVLGIALFLMGSALCGLAPTVYWLIGFRVLQSIGAAMMIALGTAILTETWPAYERGTALGFAAGFISLGIVFGPAVGGLILNYLSWRWIFYVNVPVGLIAFVLSLIFLPPMQPAGRRERFDFAGAVTMGIGLLAFTLALTVGQNIGFGEPLILLLLAIGALALPAFVWIETHVRYPMVDLSLFREPEFSLNLFTATLAFIAIAGIALLLPFYLELVLGLPLSQVGLLMAVVPVIMILLQPASGTLSDRLGTRPVSMVGLLFIFVGYVAMTTLRVDGTPLGYVLRMLPVTIGMATFNSPNNSAIMGAVPRARLGVASGILSMVRTLGQVTGIAALGAFFTTRVAHYSGAAVDLSVADPNAIISALHDQFMVVAGLILLGIVVAGLTWRWEIRTGRTKKAARQRAAEQPVVDGV
ncbi:MAG: MFS transporter [Caldilineaceae bacterium]|nr:MFS transporter [Caldilineaceae bacterium]